MTRRAFEKIVRESLRSLPKRFKERLANVDVVIEEGEEDGDTLGLYEGVALKDRGDGYSGVLPDKITLFQKAIEAHCRAHRTDIRREVHDTICHEIAHHFGIDDCRLDELDVY